jgi:hypothetical protein
MYVRFLASEEASDGGKTASFGETFGCHVGVVAGRGFRAVRRFCRLDSSKI